MTRCNRCARPAPPLPDAYPVNPVTFLGERGWLLEGEASWRCPRCQVQRRERVPSLDLEFYRTDV